MCLIFLPFLIYISIFELHFIALRYRYVYTVTLSVLIFTIRGQAIYVFVNQLSLSLSLSPSFSSGNGDGFFSSEFQATLVGNELYNQQVPECKLVIIIVCQLACSVS